jgi:hypothetical protein
MLTDAIRELTIDELGGVTGGCCCGTPGCECGPEMHTDLIPNLYPTDLTNFKPFLIARTVCE